MRNNVLILSAFAFGCLVGGGWAHADSLVSVGPNSDITGNEVISSGVFPGTPPTTQGWYTTGPGQTPSTVTGTGTTGPGGLNVVDVSGNGTSNYSLRDNYSAGQASNVAGTIAGQQYGFVDTYVLNLPTSSLASFEVSVNVCGGGTCAGVSNLTARLYAYTAGGANNLTVGGVGAPASGSVVLWTPTTVSGSFDYTSFNSPTLTGGEYVLQIAGLAASGGGAFTGNLGVTAVPLPAALPLLLSGIAGLGALARRRRVALA
jgi:hypothetical protein